MCRPVGPKGNKGYITFSSPREVYPFFPSIGSEVRAQLVAKDQLDKLVTPKKELGIKDEKSYNFACLNVCGNAVFYPVCDKHFIMNHGRMADGPIMYYRKK